MLDYLWLNSIRVCLYINKTFIRTLQNLPENLKFVNFPKIYKSRVPNILTLCCRWKSLFYIHISQSMINILKLFSQILLAFSLIKNFEIRKKHEIYCWGVYQISQRSVREIYFFKWLSWVQSQLKHKGNHHALLHSLAFGIIIPKKCSIKVFAQNVIYRPCRRYSKQ